MKYSGHIVLLCLSFGVFFFSHGNYWQSHWLSKWSFLVGSFSFFFAYCIAIRTHAVLLPVIGWSLISAASIGAWSNNIYAEVADPLSLLAIEKNALYAYIVILMAAVFLAFFKSTYVGISKFYLAAICMISVVCTNLLPLGDGIKTGLFSGNPSMNGSLIAALIPFVLETTDLIPLQVGLWAFCSLAVYRTDASVPIVVLGVTTAAWLWSRSIHGLRSSIVIIAILSGLAALGQLTVRHQPFIHDSGRIHIWKMMFNWWKDNSNIWTGMRLGSFQIITPIVQVMNNPKENNFFIWCHNDILQILLEMGIIGFTFFAVAWAYIAKRSYGHSALFASLMGFTAMAFLNYPFRLPIHAFSMVLIVSMILRSKEPISYPLFSPSRDSLSRYSLR